MLGWLLFVLVEFDFVRWFCRFVDLGFVVGLWVVVFGICLMGWGVWHILDERLFFVGFRMSRF